MTVGAITWDAARASGFVAYGLLSASVALGLALSLGWRSPRWSRFVTNETHRFLTLLALVFTAVHALAVAVDPFIRFSLPEILVPFVSHYRPAWIALGIVGAYLLAAVYASEWIRPYVGYAWWRRFHSLAFVVYLLATVHGIATGSDTRTPWAVLVYGWSAVLIGALLAVRLFPPPPRLARPLVAAVCGLVLAAGVLWTWSGPLQPGWNVIANNGNGPGGSLTAESPGSDTPAADFSAGTDPSATVGPVLGSDGSQGTFSAPFSASVSETESSGHDELVVDGTLQSTPSGSFELTLTAGDDGTAITAGELTLRTGSGLDCAGPLSSLDRGHLAATCTDAGSAVWLVTLDARTTGEASLDGTLQASPRPTGALDGLDRRS